MSAALWTPEINYKIIFPLCKVYKWTLNLILMTNSPQEPAAPQALLGLLEGRAGGVAVSWSEGVGWAGRSCRQALQKWPVLSELGWFFSVGKGHLAGVHLGLLSAGSSHGWPARVLQEGRLARVLACHISYRTGDLSRSQTLPPPANLPGCSICRGDLRGCSGAICNILMTILTPLIVNDGEISLSVAAWRIIFALLKWQNIH